MKLDHADRSLKEKIPIDWNKIPWWAIILGLVGLLVGYSVLTSETYLNVIKFVGVGVGLTLRVTVISYSVAVILGLVLGLLRVSDNPVLYAFSTLYVEVMRGLPILVIILYTGFVIVPEFRNWSGINLQGTPAAILGLAAGYAAYVAEVFRSGIESIEKGQMEAARSLGMNYMEAMRHVILPQAIRRVLPPLGNNFIAMLKDSSLISVIALEDLLQRGRLYVSRTYRAFEGYNTVALLYLVMTLGLSLLVRYIERRSSID
jgi:polar amino acid transport system permease protein